jgi:tetratricopeptide (TPR) repeat protein
MALTAYDPCPCGSGKKFKWCCQPIHVEMDKAFRLESEGQHDAALRVMDEVIAKHPDNPEALGRKAELLYRNDRVEEAEDTLQKALDLSPGYAFGHLLRAVFRQNEGEVHGALLELRKAADLYDPEARNFLAQVYSMIAECELKMNRPVAARAALEIAIRCDPGTEDLRRSLDEVFGEQSRLPKVARQKYTFQSPARIDPARRAEAERLLGGVEQGKLGQAAQAFERLTEQVPDEPAGWYNLGLARAWLGDNARALEALDRYTTLEPDEQKAGDAWALGEVVRCGNGMDAQADYLEHAALYELREPRALVGLLQSWDQERRFIPIQVNQEQGMMHALLLEKLPGLTPELAATRLARLAAHVLVVGGHLRLWHTDANALRDVCAEVEQRLGAAVAPVRSEELPANFQDVLAEALAFPVHAADKEEASRRIDEHIGRYFEETWIHRPLRSLNQIPPIDAAGHAVLRKKLRGVVTFLENCAALGQVQNYDSSRLRRKLGLLEAVPAGAGGQTTDISGMSAADLAALPAAELSEDQLEQAYQASLKLDARDLAGRFARALVSRPPRAEHLDRFPWYSHLVQLALADGDTAAALDWVNAGEKVDGEQNSGLRHNEYELRRGQIHAKRGESEEAQGVFERLIERAPDQLKYRGTAAEAMLSSRQAARALHFAEQGLAKAREKNDRDSEDYFKELVQAARKQVPS